MKKKVRKKVLKNTSVPDLPLEGSLRIEFETKEGIDSAIFVGTPEEAEIHFSRMNTEKEPLTILNIGAI